MGQKFFTLMVLVVVLSTLGCSSGNNKQALGDFEYAKKSDVKALNIPDGLDKPKQRELYTIPNVAMTGAIGNEVDVRAPSLVLPVATSSRIDEQTDKAKVWFDQVIEGIDLKSFIIAAIKKEVSDQNITFTPVGNAESVYESGWYQHTQEQGYWLFKSNEVVESLRYLFTIDSEAHGRSVSVSVDLAEYKNADGNTTIDAIDQHRAEVNMLNEVIAQVDYQYRLKQRQDRVTRANQKFVSIGEDKKGNAAYLVELERDLLWSNLPFFFEKYGFVIDDLNESNKVYFVNYTRPEIGFWDSLWGDNQPVVNLPNGKYQFKLSGEDNQTSVTIFDDSNNALSKETLESIFDVMEEALSFRKAL